MSVELAPTISGAPARRWKTYPAYKDSGVEWLRDIPMGWNVNRIKFTSYVKGRVGWHGLRSDEFTDVGPFLVTGTDFSNGKINWETCHHFSEDRYDEDPYIQLKENDLLITKDGTIGKVAIVEKLSGKASLNSGIMLIRPLKKHYMKEFMFWVLNSNLFSEYNEYTKAGSTIQHLYQETFEDFSFPVPPFPEQNLVVSFLDRQTAHLDALISRKERLIELLEEKRTALISSAVTKGIDSNAPMKDSGVEWLGKTPANWRISKFRRICRVQQGLQMAQANRFAEPGPNRFEYITVKSIHAGDTSNSKEYIENPPQSVICTPDDILLARTGGTGEVISGQSGVFHNNFFKVIYNRNLVDKKFLIYYLSNIQIKEHLLLLAGTTTIPDLNHGEFLDTPFLFPAIDEQKAIVSYIDRETAKLDALIGKIHDGIERLHEYRTALISAAVTGRIDVRAAVG